MRRVKRRGRGGAEEEEKDEKKDAFLCVSILVL
jgi:hypothetical protein